MKIKSIRQVKNLKGKKALMRVDFNVPLVSGRVGKSEDFRLVRTAPTIRYLIKKGAKVIIMAHLGRPDGKVNPEFSLKPVAKRLSQIIEQPVKLSPQIIGAQTDKLIGQMKNGEVLLLENVRFDAREELADKNFARELAKLGDLYVNDGFAVSHRDQASVSTIQQFLPSYAGLLMEEEIKYLSRALENPRQPLVVIIGGAKISTKIKVIRNFAKLAKRILLGGALANTVLKVMGVSVGRSAIEPVMFPEVKKFKLTDNLIAVPVDGVMALKTDAKKGRIDALADIKPNELILDIGPDTVRLYENILKSAKMVMWNGPMGLIENPTFAQGTKKLVKILADSKAETIVGGGETVQLIRKMKLENKFSFISTGGGAMLEFLEGKKLPGLKKIIKRLPRSDDYSLPRNDEL
ncbi:MAG: phosphoglycerate kinase [Patescibacteria group bacterium]|jgi:3-phosphoglycerate kinase